MVKWDTSTVVAWLAAVASTSKVLFDHFGGKKDREQKTELAEHQIESTERIDLTKILKESLDSMRQDIVRLDKRSADLDKKATDNEMAWIEEAKKRLDIQKELNSANGEIEALKKNNRYYEGLIEQYQRENVELRSQVAELTSRVSQFQNDNYELQKRMSSMQRQVNQNSESILVDILPVGGPEVILNQISPPPLDKFAEKELGE